MVLSPVTDDAARATETAKLTPGFAELYAAHQRMLHAYIAATVADRNRADEIFQQTSLVLCQKFSTFEPGTNFAAWAYAVARLEILKFRQRAARDRLWLSSEAIDAIADEVTRASSELDERQALLVKCLGELSHEQRTLIQQRYCDGAGIEQLAAHFGRSVDAIYQNLSRVRRGLQRCVERRLAMERAR